VTIDSADPYVEDPNYFRLRYQLAAMQLNAALGGHALVIDGHRATPQDLLKETVASASAVIEECQGLLERYRTRTQQRDWRRGFRKHRLRPNEARLQGFLKRTVLPSAQIVLAGALREQGHLEQATEIVADVRARVDTGLSYRAIYNLACYEASGDEGTAGPRVALEELRQAFRHAHGRRRWRLVAWAREDPSLEPLSKNPKYRHTFHEMLARYDAPSPNRETPTRERTGGRRRGLRRGSDK
jgi:hypothetical protein